MARFIAPALQKSHGRFQLKTWIPAILFILAVCLSIFTTHYATNHYLDGDASSELVLAHHLAQTGQLLSQDWYYSTELRVLNTQLIYAPLFRVFSDWHMVRFTGALIMQALLVLSFGYLCRQAGVSLGAFFLGAALLISPTSVAYGRVVLYHCYYMPHIILGFLIVGLYISVINRDRHTHSYPLCFCALLLFSFLSGLGGSRQIIITHVPLLVLLLYLVLRAADSPFILSAILKNAGRIIPCLCACAACLCGILVNLLILSKPYSFRNNALIVLEFINADRFFEVLYGLLHIFGFQKGASLSTPAGFASLGAVVIALYCLIYSIRALVRFPGISLLAKHIAGVFCCSVLFIILAAFFLISEDWVYSYICYLLPACVWFIPFLCMQYDALPDNLLRIRFADAWLILSLLCFIPSIGVNARFYLPHPESYSLCYEGVVYSNEHLRQQLDPCIELLQSQEYTYGYSTFWSANTATEMTDGRIRILPLHYLSEDAPTLRYRKWLTLKPYLDETPGKAFLLLTSEENEIYQQMPYPYKGEIIYPDDGIFIIYGFDDPAVLSSMITQ